MIKFLRMEAAPCAQMASHFRLVRSGAGAGGLQLAQGQRGVHALLLIGGKERLS